MLIDEPRGDEENFDRIGVEHAPKIEFRWLIPLHETKYQTILLDAIKSFDELKEESDQSLVDVNKKSFF